MPNARPARLTVDRKAENAPHRCRECGRLRAGIAKCPEHPEAELIPWAAKQTRDCTLVAGAARTGHDANDERYFPGLTPGEVALAETYLADWGGDLPERRATEERSGVTLFGAR